MKVRLRAGQRPVRVLIVDDDARILETLDRWVDAQRDMSVVGQAGDGRTALALAKRLDPDVIVIDVKLPGLSGFEVIRRLRRSGLRMPVVVLSSDDRFEDEATGLGAAFLAKGRAGGREVVAAIRGGSGATG